MSSTFMETIALIVRSRSVDEHFCHTYEDDHNTVSKIYDRKNLSFGPLYHIETSPNA